jgi:hypothetical protein
MLPLLLLTNPMQPTCPVLPMLHRHQQVQRIWLQMRRAQALKRVTTRTEKSNQKHNALTTALCSHSNKARTSPAVAFSALLRLNQRRQRASPTLKHKANLVVMGSAALF